MSARRIRPFPRPVHVERVASDDSRAPGEGGVAMPLTRLARSRSQADLSPHAGRGEEKAEIAR
jgi:hypothetical protein